MALNNTTPGADSSGRAAARLRTIGLVILLLGLVGAGLVYWMGAPKEDLSDAVPDVNTSKQVAREVEMNFGKMGLFASGLSKDLQDPAIQAALVVVVSILVACGCFYVAHLHDRASGEGA